MYTTAVSVLLTRFRGRRGVSSTRQGASFIQTAAPIVLQEHALPLVGTALLDRPATARLDAMTKAIDKSRELVGVELGAQMARHMGSEYEWNRKLGYASCDPRLRSLW